MRNILMSIKPKWVEKILNGEKTIEIRKSIPKCELPCKVYIYCTKGKELWGDGTGNTWYGIAEDEDMERVFELTPTLARLNGKVVAEFILNKYDFLIDCGFGVHYADQDLKDLDLDHLRTNSCLTDEQIYQYLGFKENSGYYNDGYAWRIDDLIIYDTPKELSEFSSIIKRMNGKESRFTSHLLQRPPQSWCYVEERESEI